MINAMPKHCIISGGSSGIGRALGRKLASRGYNLTLIARRPHLLREAAEEIRSVGAESQQRIETHVADVSDRTQVEAAIEASVGQLGAPDLVITSAGVAVPNYFGDASVSDFERAMAVNYFGTLYIVRAALQTMRVRQQGRIVLISSGAALMGIFGYGSYGPSKFAVRGLAETLRAELRPNNIGVSIVYPPDTETPMLEEENKTKPLETKLISSLAKTWSADAVADCILRGIDRNKFAITPGLTITLMHRMPGIILPVLGWYCDRLVHRARRSINERPSTASAAAMESTGSDAGRASLRYHPGR
jgi:3-dehydrosphinganine reductase